MQTAKPLVTICIPTYNGAKVLWETLESALSQDYPNKEILISDDGSSDTTVYVAELYKAHNPCIRIISSIKNNGLGKNLTLLMKEAMGKYIVYLCQDDIFTHKSVVSDMMDVFACNFLIGVVGRPYYQYMNGHHGAVMTIRTNIYISSCNPSGIGFKKDAMVGEFSSKLFVEMPSMVKRVLISYWIYAMMDYDTIAARLHPGPKGNAATAPTYFKFGKGQSQTENWFREVGIIFIYPMYFIQLKICHPEQLIEEIKTCYRLRPGIIFNIGFVFCAIVAIIIPGHILRHLSNFYRHRITRYFVKEIKRPCR